MSLSAAAPIYSLPDGPLSLCFAPLTRVEFAHSICVCKRWNSTARLKSAWPLMDPGAVTNVLSVGRWLQFGFPVRMWMKDQTVEKLIEEHTVRLRERMKVCSPWREGRFVHLPTMGHTCEGKYLHLILELYPHVEHLKFDVSTPMLRDFLMPFLTLIAPKLSGLHMVGGNLPENIAVFVKLRVLQVFAIPVPSLLLSLHSLESLHIFGWSMKIMEYRQNGLDSKVPPLRTKIVDSMRAIRHLSVEHRLRSLTVGLDSTDSLAALVNDDSDHSPPAHLTHLSVSLSSDEIPCPPSSFDFILDRLPHLTSFQAKGSSRDRKMKLSSQILPKIQFLHFDLPEGAEVKLLLSHTPNVTKLEVNLNREFKQQLNISCLSRLKEFYLCQTNPWLDESLSDNFFSSFGIPQYLEVIELPISPRLFFTTRNGPDHLAILTQLPYLTRIIFVTKEPRSLALFDARVLHLLSHSVSLRQMIVREDCRRPSSNPTSLVPTCHDSLVPGGVQRLSTTEIDRLLRFRLWTVRTYLQVHRCFRLQRDGKKDLRWFDAATGKEAVSRSRLKPKNTIYK